MSPVQKEETPQLSPEEELIAFLQWIEMMIHDLESVPDEDSARFWCPQWWQHPEAVSRFMALHRGYIQAGADHQLSQWWIHQWDAHARVIFGPTGPFESCRYGHAFFQKAESYNPRMVTELPPEKWVP